MENLLDTRWFIYRKYQEKDVGEVGSQWREKVGK